MSQDRTFDELMARVRAGERDAACQVFHQFTHRLVALARRQMDARIRQKIDPEDVLQSVWKSFFGRHADGQFDLQGWDGLWALLAQITVRKCGRWNVHFRAQRRNVGREGSEARSPGPEADWQALASDPTPEEAAKLVEMVEELMAPLAEEDRPILMLRLQGHTVEEISTLLGRTEYMVNRVLKRVRRRLEELLDGDANA